MPTHSELQFHLLMATFVSLALLLGWLCIARRGELFGDLDGVDRVLIPAAALLALALRWSVADWVIFHENGHGYRLLEMAVRPQEDLHVYGSAHQAFFHLLFLLLPPTGDTMIGGTVLLGALTVLPAGLLMARLFGAGAGAGAALALALLPLHIHQSATESRFVFALAFWILALWLAVELRRRPSMPLALACALAAAPAGQVRPVLAWVPLSVPLFALLAGPRPLAFLRRREPWLLAGAIALLSAGHAHWMWIVHSGEAARANARRLVDFSLAGLMSGLEKGPVLLDASVLPRSYLALAALGLLGGLLVRRRATALLAPLGALLVWLYASRASGFGELVRFALPPQVFFALLAGAGAGLLTQAAARIAGQRRAVGAAVVLHGLLPVFPAVMPAQSTAQAREYRFLRAAYPALPAGCALVKAGRRPNSGVNDSFPFTEFRYFVPGPDREEGGLAETTTADIEELRASHPCVLYYRGLACFSFERDEPRDPPIRSRCLRFEEEHRLVPLIVDQVDPAALAPYRFELPEREFTLAFFRVEGRHESDASAVDLPRPGS